MKGRNFINGGSRIKNATVILILVVISLIVLTACVRAVPEEELVSEDQPLSEAMTEDVQQTTDPIERVAPSASTFYAENPELMVAERYVAKAVDPSRYYAANPELMAAERFVAPAMPERSTASTFYAENPELMVAERYAAKAGADAMIPSGYYAANPELMAAQRYVTEMLEQQ